MMDAMPDLADLRGRLVGREIGGGPVSVPPHERIIGHRALAWTEAEGQELHPVWATLLGLRGMDLSFDELFELAEASAEDGIYFGEAGVELRQELEASTTYKVSGLITDIVRRRGKTAGTFDALTFELHLKNADGTVAATVTNSFLFVRKERP